MSDVQKNQLVNEAKGLARWFTLDFSLKIFGHEILGYHFPPKSQNND